MPTFSTTGYINALDAGTEVSSTYEGRHVNVVESDMIHPTHADGFVDKGDPILFNDIAQANYTGVGVAFASATAATDSIAVDTEGIWNLAVLSTNDLGSSDIVFGDQIFISIAAGVLSKIRNANTHRPFGYACNTTTVAGAGTATVIAVKVHWDPYWSVVCEPLCGVGGAAYVNDTVNTTFRQFRYDYGAASGAGQANYTRLYMTSAGTAHGNAARFYTDVVGVQIASAYGAHITCGFGESTTAGNVTGQATAVRATLGLPDLAMPAGGTYSAIVPEIWSFGAASDPAAVTQLSFIRCVNDGNADGITDVDDKAYLLILTGGAIAGGNIVEASTTEANYAYSARCILPGGQVAYMMFASAVG